VKIYPNPSTGKFQIVGNFHNLELFNILGHSVDYILLENTITINSPRPGMYVARFIESDLIKTVRIIVR